MIIIDTNHIKNQVKIQHVQINHETYDVNNYNQVFIRNLMYDNNSCILKIILEDLYIIFIQESTSFFTWFSHISKFYCLPKE